MDFFTKYLSGLCASRAERSSLKVEWLCGERLEGVYGRVVACERVLEWTIFCCLGFAFRVWTNRRV